MSQRTTSRRDKHSGQLKIIENLSQGLARGDKTEQVLEATLNALHAQLGYQTAQIYRLSPYGQDLWRYLAVGETDLTIINLPDIFSIETRNIVSDTVRKKQIIYITNLHKGPYATQAPAPEATPIRSEIALPLAASEDEVILGVLRVQHDKTASFPPADRQFLDTLAHLMATTIRHNQTVEELENDLQEIRILYNLQRQTDIGHGQSGVDPISGVGYSYNRNNEIIVSDELSSTARLAIAKQNTEVLANDHNSEAKELVAPIQLYGETIGVLGIASDLEQDEWTADDQRLLEEVSTQVALALENARLIQQTQAQTQELSLLFSASQRLSETIDLEQIYGILTEQMMIYLQADQGGVILLDSTTNTFIGQRVMVRENNKLLFQNRASHVSPTNDASLSKLLTQPTVLIETLQQDNLLDRQARHKEMGLLTVAIFPLLVRNEVIGLLEIGHYDADRAYNSNELQVAQAIIAQVAVAIDNALQFQKTEAALAETQKLYEISRALVETNDLDEIFNVVLTHVKEFNVDRVSISLLDPAILQNNENLTAEAVTIVASWDKESDQILPVGSKITASMFPLVESFAKPPFDPLISEDLSSPNQLDKRMDENFRLFMHEGIGAITLYSTPMFLGLEYKGVLSVSTRTPHIYSEQEKRVYQTLAGQAIIAIENRRLFEQTKATLIQTELQTERLAQLNEMSRQLSLIRDRGEIFQVAAKMVTKIFAGDRGGIGLLDADGEKIRAAALDGNNSISLGPQVPITGTLSEVVVGQSKIVVVSDFLDEEWQQFRDLQMLGKQKLRSCMMAPLVVDGKVIGTLNVANHQPQAYGSHYEGLFGQMALHLSAAIENRELFDSIQAERDQAALLVEIDQNLSQASTITEAQTIILSFAALVGASFGEIYLTDRDGFDRWDTTIPERKSNVETNIDLPVYNTLSPMLEPQALADQQTVIKNRSQIELDLSRFESLNPVQSVIALPFSARHSSLRGVLTFFYNDSNNISPNHVEMLKGIATQTVAILENLWLREQTEAALRETELLYDATREFSIAQQPEELLDALAESVITKKEVGLDSLVIGLLTQTEVGAPEQLEVVAHWSRTNGLSAMDRVMTAKEYNFLPHLKAEETTIFTTSQLNETTQTNLGQIFGDTQSIFAVPLRVGQTWLGVLLCVSQQNNFEANHQFVNQITTLAGQVAVVLRNLQLVEETQQTLYYSETLSHLSQDLLGAETSEVIYDLGLDAICATQPERGAAILMYEATDTSTELNIVAVWDNPARDWVTMERGHRFALESYETSYLHQSEQTVIAPQVATDERFSTSEKALYKKLEIESLISVPIWRNREIVGFIIVCHSSQRSFPIEMVRLYEDIGRQIAVALENQRLFKEAQYRATLLQTASEVSAAATRFLDLDTMLSQSVDLIKDRFDFHHVSIFLIDEYKKYAVVQASTGEVGQRMLTMQHKLEVGGRSIVGTATGTQQPRIAVDVGEDGGHYKNPLLPDTRSEMALPLVAGGEVIGALDVQSTRKNAFSEADITILQSMSNQLANAISAALASQKTQETLDEMQNMTQYYVQEQWEEFVNKHRQSIGYQFTSDGMFQTEEEEWSPIASRVIAEKDPIIISSHSEENGITFTSPQKRNKQGAFQLYLPSKGNQSTESQVTLAAPLNLQDGVSIGALDFEIMETNDSAWEEDRVKIVEAIANQAAQAIESARLFEQTQTSRDEAEALYQVSRTLVTAEDEQKMFHIVLEKMLLTLGLNQGGILFFDKDRKLGSLRALFENGQPVKTNQVIPIEGNASYDRLIETKRPLPIEDVMNDPLVETVRDINRQRGVASLLLVPIIIDDQVIGAIGADAVGEKHHFTEWEINLASAMADQLAIILQNHRLLEETNERALQLRTSADVGRVATSILALDEMLDQAVELIKERFGFYHVQIFLIDQENQIAFLDRSTGDVGEQLLATNYKVKLGSAGIIGQATVQTEPIVIRDANPVDFDTPYYQQFLPNTQAELAIPLQVGDQQIGVLDVHSENPEAFSDSDIATMELLADQIAIAIQNARAFKEQQETTEKLKEVDKLKTQFLANMSHELRTPLNSIIGFSRVILKGIDGPLTELQKTDLTSIHNSGQHLLGLINNILDLSKIEAGKMELNFEDVEIEPIIKGVMSTAIALVKDKPVELKQDVQENLPVIQADPTRLRQIVLNLVSNACKFTDEGYVLLQATTDNKWLTISVTDTGIGIPQEDHESIFEEFTQVDASTTRKVGGTGLGLPISRHFVELHQGKIWVESGGGQGSIFKVSIPINQDMVDEIEMPLQQALADLEEHNKTIIAIDDDPSVISLYERFLEAQGYELIGISNGENILQQVKDANPAAILLDVLMPDRDGWSVLRELKKDQTTEAIPVIICSMVSDRKRGFSLGATGYLNKPITEDDLLKALEHIHNNDKDQVKVLVIDDQADDILLIRRMLEAQQNYIIHEAQSGQDGLKFVQQDRPDLIILDLSMPEMDGFKVVETLKDKEETRSIPIIIASAKDLTPKESKFLNGQVEALLHKNIFTENELLQDVQRALNQIQQKDVIKL